MIDRLGTAPWKLVLVGAAAGIIGGGLGVGGGIILVPLLIALGLERHRAHATSLAAIVLIAVAGAISFGAANEVSWGLGLIVGVGGIIGSVLGASVMHRMSSRTLSVVFAFVLLVAGLRMIFGANPIPGSGEFNDVTRLLISAGIGVVAGFFAGVAGIGGGVVIVPSTIFFLGLAQHEAQGTSLVAIVLTAIAGTVVNMRNERVRLKDGLVVGVGGAIGSVVGSRIALLIEGRALSVAFGFLVVFVALRTLYLSFRIRSQEAVPEID